MFAIDRIRVTNLFERIRTLGAPLKDQEAEALINQCVTENTDALYVLVQLVMVHEEALKKLGAEVPSPPALGRFSHSSLLVEALFGKYGLYNLSFNSESSSVTRAPAAYALRSRQRPSNVDASAKAAIAPATSTSSISSDGLTHHKSTATSAFDGLLTAKKVARVHHSHFWTGVIPGNAFTMANVLTDDPKKNVFEVARSKGEVVEIPIANKNEGQQLVNFLKTKKGSLVIEELETKYKDVPLINLTSSNPKSLQKEVGNLLRQLSPEARQKIGDMGAGGMKGLVLGVVLESILHNTLNVLNIPPVFTTLACAAIGATMGGTDGSAHRLEARVERSAIRFVET